MDDPHRKPGTRDRDPLVTRIRRAADEGRISTADRDIRVANVTSAQSLAELDLISRDLDQLETAVPVASVAATTAAPARSAPYAADLGDEVTEKTVAAVKTTARSLGVFAVAAIVFAVIGVASSVFISQSTSSDSSGPGGLLDPLSPTEDPSVRGEVSPSPVGARYALNGPGIRGFLALYRDRFHTSQVVDLVLYDGYVVVNAPVAGRSRHQGWLYRVDQGFTRFGSVSANFPGARQVDVSRLAIPALVRNIAQARKTLGVEHPTTTYVIVRDYGDSDAPSVDIHVANGANESGYLATRLDGTVERAYPYGG